MKRELRLMECELCLIRSDSLGSEAVFVIAIEINTFRIW